MNKNTKEKRRVCVIFMGESSGGCRIGATKLKIVLLVVTSMPLKWGECGESWRRWSHKCSEGIDENQFLLWQQEQLLLWARAEHQDGSQPPNSWQHWQKHGGYSWRKPSPQLLPCHWWWQKSSQLCSRMEDQSGSKVRADMCHPKNELELPTGILEECQGLGFLKDQMWENPRNFVFLLLSHFVPGQHGLEKPRWPNKEERRAPGNSWEHLFVAPTIWLCPWSCLTLIDSLCLRSAIAWQGRAR